MEKIVGIFIPKNKRVLFNSIEEASKETNVPIGFVRRCLDTGNKYRCWCFDLIEEGNDK